MKGWIGDMKKVNLFGKVMVGVVAAVGVVCLCFGKKIKILYTSLNSFKDENLAHTFQHTPEIQPTKKISKGEDTFQFVKEDNTALADEFCFEDTFYSSEKFMEDTETSAMLVIKDDVIKYEEYFFGGDEKTLFSSNSMGKSFVSALMGIAVSEGCVGSIEDPIGKYIPEFKGTELENIPIKACLQMASGIDFSEDDDMSGFSMRTLMGTPAMKVISPEDPHICIQALCSICTDQLHVSHKYLPLLVPGAESAEAGSPNSLPARFATIQPDFESVLNSSLYNIAAVFHP